MKSLESFDAIDIQEKNAIICRFMGGKIMPFKMPDAVENTWQDCEIDFINGVDSDRNLLRFHCDWNYIMPVWLKIVSLDESTKPLVHKGRINLDRFEIGKHGIFIHVYKYISRKLGWVSKVIYHTCDNYECDSVDMMQVYYKSIIDFIEFYYEK